MMAQILRWMMVLFIPLSVFGQKNVPVMQKTATGKEHVIDVYAAYQNRTSVLKASELVEDIEFIPLETTDECLLDETLNTIVVTQSDILVFDYKKGYRFNRKGDYLNSIGIQGQGPGEYIKAMRMTVDTLNQWVYFSDGRVNRMVKYDYNGKYIGDVKLGIASSYDKILLKPNEFIIADDFYQFAKKGQKHSLYYYSEKENKLLSKLKCEHENIPRMSICHPIVYKYEEHAYLKDYWCDTLYRMKDPIHLESHAVFKKGKWGLRKEDDTSMMTGKPTDEDRIILDLLRIAETDRYILSIANKGVIVYDKQTRKTQVTDTENRIAIMDDLYGTPGVRSDYFPDGIQGNMMVAYGYPYQMIESLKANHQITDKRYDAFRQMVKNLQEDDNQVIMLLKLKK